MYLPELSNISQSKATINAFGGVNKKEDCQGNEFIDMKNMSGDNYPCISPRKKRYESDFSWTSINKISEEGADKNNLYLSCFHTDTSSYMTAVCHTKAIGDTYMDNDTIQYIITNYKNKYIKLGEKYYLIKRMDLTTVSFGDKTGVVAICLDKSYVSETMSYFTTNPPPGRLYNLYTTDDQGNYVPIPYADNIKTNFSSTRMAYVNDCFYWLKSGCINYTLSLSNIKAVCKYHDVRSGVTRLGVDIAFTDKIRTLCNAYENEGEKLKITVDGYGTFECKSDYVGEGVITFLYVAFDVGQEYTLSIETNDDTSSTVVGMLTDECDGDTDLIVGGNKIISVPSMYVYDTKYQTEERMSDKAEFCLNNGNSDNITIKRTVSKVLQEKEEAPKELYVSWTFTVNTTNTANFWKHTVKYGETKVERGYSLNENITGKPFIYFYDSDGNAFDPLYDILNVYYTLQQGNSGNKMNIPATVTEIGAGKITFEIDLTNFISNTPTLSPYCYVDYILRQRFPLSNDSEEGATKEDEEGTTTRTIANTYTTSLYATPVLYDSYVVNDTTYTDIYVTKGSSGTSTFLGYDPSYDTTIGYVPGGEMDELPFNLKFACAGDNRMFACNEEGDRIYISVIGRIHDFVNEENGTMSADDIGVLSEGKFTGIVSFNHNVYFFKEKCVHKLFGTYSDDWQLVEYRINGVQEGAEKSIVVYDNYVIYKGADAFYLYDGSIATNISEKLGSMLDMASLKCCFAGGFKDKYYACCETTEDGKTVYTTYVYDIGKGLWHIEENNSDKGFVSMYSTSRGVLALEVEENGDIDIMRTISIAGTVFDKSYEEDDFSWSATTGDLLTDIPDNKYFTKLQLRLWVDKNSRLGIDIKYDNDEWEKVGDDITATDKSSIVFPIIPRRCDHLALRFNGKGNAKIFSITETIEEASEI